MRNLLLLLVAAALLYTPTLAQKPYDDPDAYAVYSALIRDYTKNDKDASMNLVIIPETTDYPNFSAEINKIENCVKPAPGEEVALTEMLSSYKDANKTPVLLQQKFDIPYKYQIVPRSVIHGFFSTKGEDGWNTYEHRYPNTPGYMDMSAVGFNKDRTLAVVYFARHCGWLCADGTYYLLKKANGKWTSKGQRGCIWVS